MRESDIEKRLREGIEALGGLCLKFVSPGRRGVPDRIVFFNGYCVFVELKAPGKKPTPAQKRMHNELRLRGFYVNIIDKVKDVDEFVKHISLGYYDL